MIPNTTVRRVALTTKSLLSMVVSPLYLTSAGTLRMLLRHERSAGIPNRTRVKISSHCQYLIPDERELPSVWRRQSLRPLLRRRIIGDRICVSVDDLPLILPATEDRRHSQRKGLGLGSGWDMWPMPTVFLRMAQSSSC